MILDRSEQLAAFRALVAGTTIQEVLDGRCAAAVLDALDALVTACLEDSSHYYFPLPWSVPIAERLPYAGDAWAAIRAHSARRLPKWDILPWSVILEVLIAGFRPENAEAWIDYDALRLREPQLSFDKDGLVDSSQVEFLKEGGLTPRHWLQYHESLPGKFASGAFVEDVIAVGKDTNAKCLAFLLQPDAILARAHYRGIATRAYIRGPIGISEAMLNDPRFPEDKRGTVTEHQRVGTNPLFQLFPVDRFEVMWSERRDDKKGEHVKVVQMEELVPLRRQAELTANRYVHSEWDCNLRKFTHFDGAIRGYTREQYQSRTQTDIKKAGKSARLYQKVFRLDSELDAPTWSRLVGKFFDRNELAIEYLGGADPSEQQ